MARLTVIVGSPPPATPKQRVLDRVKRTQKAQDLLQCPRCGCREVVVLITGMTIVDGEPKGGTRQHACSACFMKGERIVLA